MRYASRRVDDPPGVHRALEKCADRGVVQSARKPRCIACGNCVIACPFGVPELYEDRQIMMKCDMCYDRSSVGKKPMCATVCPSQALFFGTREQIEQLRPLSTPVNRFQFGSQMISTRVFMMAPRALASPQAYVDVTAAMEEQPHERSVVLRVVPSLFACHAFDPSEDHPTGIRSEKS